MTDADVASGPVFAPRADDARPAARAPEAAAERPEPRRLTASEFRAKIAEGEIDGAAPAELIEGRVARRPIATPVHERVRLRLANLISDRIADGLIVADETKLILGQDTVLAPDLFVFSRKTVSPLVRGPDAALVVEITAEPAETALLARAPIYAAHGVRELQVFDLGTGEVHLFDDPEEGRYRRSETLGPGAPVASSTCPGLKVSLAEILRSI
ncbi:MAG: Uma2 family endonuclease [Maricaulaceae bacterium]|jgi:Uma2 family endonuclease